MIFEGFPGRPQIEASPSGGGNPGFLAGSNNNHSGPNPAIQDWKEGPYKDNQDLDKDWRTLLTHELGLEGPLTGD